MQESIKLDLKKGEVKVLPLPKHYTVSPLVARSDDERGTGEELVVLIPGEDGMRILPYGSVFLDYEHGTNRPVFQLPDGTYSNAVKEPITATGTEKEKEEITIT